MAGEGTYAPKSPDLSSFYSRPAPVPQQQEIPAYQQPYASAPPQHAPYHPQPPPHQQHLQPPQQGFYQPPTQPYSTAQQQPHNLVGESYLQSPPPQHQHALPPTPQSAQPPFYAAPASQPFGQPPSLQPPTAYVNQGPPLSPQQQQQQPQAQQQSQQPPQYYQSYGVPQYQQTPGQQQQQQYGLPQGYSLQPGFFPPDSYQAPPPDQQSVYQQAPIPAPIPAPSSGSPPPSAVDAGMPPRRAAAAAAATAAGGGGGVPSAGGSSTAPPVAPSPVRTKFPTARIKRIMQADEEVGKVSQQTPIAVGKALELFMVALVSKSAEVARTKNSKRVTAQMLKQVVESDDQWDFLRDIVKKVDPEEKHGRGPRNSTGATADGANGGGPGSGTKLKYESDSGDEQPRKRGRPGRKKKV